MALAVDGKAIPLLGFAEMTFVGAVLGGLILGALNRCSGRARERVPDHRSALESIAPDPPRQEVD